jgi:hypothetical protein
LHHVSIRLPLWSEHSKPVAVTWAQFLCPRVNARLPVGY